jgi:hypothetical protein
MLHQVEIRRGPAARVPHGPHPGGLPLSTLSSGPRPIGRLRTYFGQLRCCRVLVKITGKDGTYNHLVRPVRFELTTFCSGGKRSIQTELRAHITKARKDGLPCITTKKRVDLWSHMVTPRNAEQTLHPPSRTPWRSVGCQSGCIVSKY